MKPRLASLLLLLACLGVVVAGCGGGSSSGGGDFTAGAEAACTSANEQIAALGTPQQVEVLQYLEQTEDVIEKLHKEVAALGADGSAETEYTAALAKSLPILTQMTNAARNENYDAVREISDELVELDLGEKAEAAELKSCAEVPAASES